MMYVLLVVQTSYEPAMYLLLKCEMAILIALVNISFVISGYIFQIRQRRYDFEVTV